MTSNFELTKNSAATATATATATTKNNKNKKNNKLIRNSSRTQRTIIRRCDSTTAWLIYYFAFNLGLTIFNKRVLISFPFPWTLTAIHTLAGTIGTQLAHANGIFTAARLSRNHSIILIAFSILYTVNIAVSNLSLHLVTVPFHQVVRATTPLFTIILSIIYFNKKYPIETYFSLLIVVTGVGLSTYGDYGWTLTGLLLTLLGTILASFKTIVTNLILVGRLRLNPLDLLMRMSPLAFVQCLIYAYLTGEIHRVKIFAVDHLDSEKVAALIVNGIIAFGLNVVSFTANKKTSALTMTVAANVKQVLTILSAIMIFKLVITPMNLIGILITLIGGGYYAKIELDRKHVHKDQDLVLIIPNNTHSHHHTGYSMEGEEEDQEEDHEGQEGGNHFQDLHSNHLHHKLLDEEQADHHHHQHQADHPHQREESRGELIIGTANKHHPLQINSVHSSKHRSFIHLPTSSSSTISTSSSSSSVTTIGDRDLENGNRSAAAAAAAGAEGNSTPTLKIIEPR
ncbi:hypothetical protein Pst134EA_005419 [Puccinia striiformis f. sp. tritici]|uniref:hypothetical protein n=1 Tax=Puccinia striiformis f. sp. tritici TaxID=168172 RepID=UPI0020075213|nr:hypothetical protein Pst134EA_005419 [Puccinia striiformis f. sp. tritici]KAH9471524.1 hypothetical protein Pst134EA_005419 [Puccinia striiformis f. sp. tritici]